MKISRWQQALRGFLLERHGEAQAFEPGDRLRFEATRFDPVEVVGS